MIPAFAAGEGPCITMRLSLAWGICCLASCVDRTTDDPPGGPSVPARVSTATLSDELLKSPSDTMPVEVLATTPAARATTPDDWLEDVTESSGLRFSYRNGVESRQYAMVEELGGGVALFDFDNDGDLDAYLTGGGEIGANQQPQGRAGALFRNDGDLRFTDVTQAVGLDQPGDYSHGVTVGDYDRDGWQDLFITAYGRSQLFRNVDGRKFVDRTDAAGLVVDGWHASATFLDIDRDGWLDLYLCGYTLWKPGSPYLLGGDKQGVLEVRMPIDVPGAPDLLFRGSSEGTFTNVTEEAGIRPDGRGLGVVAADLNSDGWIDLYVANDIDPNHLYWGGPTLPFREGALSAGVQGSEYGQPESSMGIDAGDYDGDGRLDLFVTNYEREDNALYRSESSGFFTHRTAPAGLAGRCRPFVGFATEFLDLDLDGWLDLYLLNGHVVYHQRKSPYRQPAFVYRNRAGERFEDVSDQAAAYFTVTHVGRGGAYGDLDNDGDLDLIFCHQNEPATVLCNRRTAKNWLCVSLEGVVSNRDAIGAVVTSAWDGRTLTRVIRGGGSYLSCSDRRVLVPCSSELQTVEILWPNGLRESFSGLRPGQMLRLREGSGEALESQAPDAAP